MKTIIMIALSLLITTGCMYGQTTQPPPVPAEEQPEVQTRGPVNEAFAQPVTIEENDGLTVPKAPPADIDETPPAERPVGEQFTWIPGYWAWDSERNEHIWISGCWRAVPPGKYWVSGYWAKVQSGYRWVPGFWAISSEREIEYLPPPPKVTYIEPQGPENSDMIWVPACYYWSHGRYTLREGYWLQAREDWVWVPSHYVWTPRGYIFVRGHWDYPLVRRGVLFAPVYFRGNIYGGHRLSYSLSIAIDLGSFEFGLFTRPGYRHYYFGDYYDDFYIGIGIFPWFECMSRHTWYDPIYMHDHWRHRRDNRDWRNHERREYERRRNDRDLRPPRTYHEMERRMTSMPESRRSNYEVAAPMKRMIERNTALFKYRQTQSDDRKQIIRHKEDVFKYRNDRIRRESLDDRGRNNGFEREKTRTQKPIEKQGAVERKKPDFPPYEQRKSQDREYNKKTNIINSNEERKIQVPVEQRNPDSKSIEMRDRRVPTERKGRDFVPSVQKNVTESAPIKEQQGNNVNSGSKSFPLLRKYIEERNQKQTSSETDKGEVKKEIKELPVRGKLRK